MSVALAERKSLPVRGVSPALIARIEAMEIRGRELRWRSIPSDLARRLRPDMARVGDGLFTLAPGSESLHHNRLLDLGRSGRATPAMLDEAVARARAAGLTRFVIEPTAGPQGARIARWALARGFVRRLGLALLLRDARTPLPRLVGAPRVVRATGRRRLTAVDIIDRSFGTPASQRGWSRAMAVSGDWDYFLAFAGRTAIGMGVLRMEDRLAWLAGGATLTRWRGRGAQSAIIAARVRRAARRGCRWAWSETLEPARGRPGGSRRNLLRLGFVEVCRKPLFEWRR